MRHNQTEFDFEKFDDAKPLKQHAPLAYRTQPINLEQFIGHEEFIKKVNRYEQKNIPHFILWGPPGCGKTTLANVLAHHMNVDLFKFNAVLGGVNDLRKLIHSAKEMKEYYGLKSIIFIDEIHRFNKAQQDALLPYLERGDFILIGATTESPKTSLNPAILSRVSPVRLNPYSKTEIIKILMRASDKERIEACAEVYDILSEYSNGDARSALNNLESLSLQFDNMKNISVLEVQSSLTENARKYDKNGNRHYDVVSAFIKSIRGSDVNASLLWLAVMIDGNEDPIFIARRLILLASEDIGNADPRALTIACNAHYAVKNIGMPEARIPLAQATTYLAQAPKSNSSYIGIDQALEFVKNSPTVEVPEHLRNLGPETKNYKYPHQYEMHYVSQEYSPISKSFFESSKMGYEKFQSEYIEHIKEK